MVAVPVEAECPGGSVRCSDQTWGRGRRRSLWREPVPPLPPAPGGGCPSSLELQHPHQHRAPGAWSWRCPGDSRPGTHGGVADLCCGEVLAAPRTAP